MRPRVSSISNSSDDGPDLELPGRDDVETAEGGREAIFCGKTTNTANTTNKKNAGPVSPVSCPHSIQTF